MPNSAQTSSIMMPKPLMIGATILILLGLFLASGDPGKQERAQLNQAMNEAQIKIAQLESTLSEQQVQLKTLQENNQLLARRVDVSDENNTRLRARVDEAERQLIAQRKAANAVLVKPQNKSQTVAKSTAINKQANPAKKPTAKQPNR